MPKIYQRTARQDIWREGFRSPANNKQGYTVDRSIPGSTSDHEDPDQLLVKKGQTYYTWHPKGQPWQYSLEKPVFVRQKSEWEEKLDGFQTRAAYFDGEAGEDEDYENDKETLEREIEEYRDELQERLDNIPYQLQESSVLNERIEELDGLLTSLQ